MKIATLTEHINDLRLAIIRSLVMLLLFVFISYFLADLIIKILSLPLMSSVFAPKTMIYTGLADGFISRMNIATSFGFFTSIPYIIFEIYKFCAVGMYKNEKLLAKSIILAIFSLFLIGCLIGYYFIIPNCIDFFLSYGQNVTNLPLDFQLKLVDYLDMIIGIMIICGIVMQIPIIIVLLHIMGLMKYSVITKYRRHWIVFVFILSAIITPPDILSQIVIAGIILLSTEIAIFGCKLFDKNKIKSL